MAYKTKGGLTNSPFIGVQNFCVAKLLNDPADGTAEYEEAVHIPWLRQVQIKPQSSEETLYADNASIATSKVVSKYELTIATATMPLEYKALLLGHKYDETKGTISVSSDDVAPYFMLMFETNKQNGKKRLVKFTKVQFSEPEENAQTREEKISYNTPQMSATAVYRTSDHVALLQADEEAEGYTDEVGANWFTTVPVSTTTTSTNA